MAQHLDRRQVLGDVRDELTYRSTRRAKQLLREVEGVLTGAVPLPPKPPGPDTADNQMDLLAGE